MVGFGLWLQTHIERLDTNISGLARLLRVSQSSVSQWMSGATDPGRDNMFKLARVLGVHPIDVVAAVYEIDIPGDLSERERATLDLLASLEPDLAEIGAALHDTLRQQQQERDRRGTDDMPAASSGDDE